MATEIVERAASAMAVLFNGGSWHTHYTADQKELWRTRARLILQGLDWRK